MRRIYEYRMEEIPEGRMNLHSGDFLDVFLAKYY
jgi:hypothetical protein